MNLLPFAQHPGQQREIAFDMGNPFLVSRDVFAATLARDWKSKWYSAAGFGVPRHDNP